MGFIVSPQQLGQLTPFVQTLVCWLRQEEPTKAGDVFASSTANPDEVQSSLRELLNAINYNGDLSNSQIRYICSCHEVTVWASAIRLIIAESEPRLVPNEVGVLLLSTLDKLGDSMDDVEQASFALGPVLDQLPRSQFVALGEFCALLRDTSDDARQLAMLAGPLLLAPRGGQVSPNTTNSAVTTMFALIIHAEAIFGRVAAKSENNAFGLRKPVVSSALAAAKRQGSMTILTKEPSSSFLQEQKPTPPSPTSATSPVMERKSSNHEAAQAAMAKRMQQLRAFYLWRDPTRADKVPMLFASHSFEDIAKAVMIKYGMLPPGWKVELQELKMLGSKKLDWFHDDDHKGKKKKGSAAAAAAAAATASSGPILPKNGIPPPPGLGIRPSSMRNLTAVRKKGNGNDHDYEFTVDPENPSTPAPPPPPLTTVDRVVNEIADTEQSYHDMLAELLESYVKTIRIISSGQKGTEAAESLGLTNAEVEQIFGWRLEEIINVSTSLLSKLEVVTLVRSEPLTGEGRQGLVAEAFIEISNELHVYAPYVSAHKSSLQALDRAMKKLSEKQKAPRSTGLGAQLLQRGRTNEKPGGELTFVKLWEVVSSASPRLKGQSINSILIMPVQRVPRYKLLLKELHKETSPDHKAYGPLTKALDLIDAAALQINEALRQHEKLGKFFGEGEMLNPTSAETTNSKGGNKIKNQY